MCIIRITGTVDRHSPVQLSILIRMDQEVTLRVTLIKLKLLESITRYSKTQVSIVFGKLSQVIPNPRFISNKEAHFYRQRLELTNKTTEKAFIKVFGIKNSESSMEEIASQHIYVSSIKENKVFILSNSKVKLEYEATVLKNFSTMSLEDDENEESRTEVALDTERLSNGIHFQPMGYKRASTINMENKRKTEEDDQKTRDKSPLLSQQEFKHAHDTLTNYKENSNGSLQYDDLWNNRSEINFLEPITHTPPRSPKSSLNKINFNKSTEKGDKDPNGSPNKEKPFKSAPTCLNPASKPIMKPSSRQQPLNLLHLSLVAILSFLMGMFVKQTL